MDEDENSRSSLDTDEDYDVYYDNSDSSSNPYNDDYTSEADDNSDSSSEGEQPAEILEENNNDPNNNMEGGVENAAVIAPIVELPVSPRPGCSKDLDDNTVTGTTGIPADVHRAAVRIQKFLLSRTYENIVSILEERPNFECEVEKLFRKFSREVSLKRGHGEDICDIEEKRVMQASGEMNNGAGGSGGQEQLPEAVLDGVPVGDVKNQELTPPTQGSSGASYTRQNNTPISIYSDSEEEDLIWSNVGKPRILHSLQGGEEGRYEPVRVKESMAWRDSKTATVTNGVGAKVNTCGRAPAKVKTVPATIVREEQAAMKPIAVPPPLAAPLIRPSRLPAPTGSVQVSSTKRKCSSPTRKATRYPGSPIVGGRLIVGDIPTKLKFISRARQAMNAQPATSIPQNAGRMPRPIDGRLPVMFDQRPKPATAARPPPAKAPFPFDHIAREFLEADRQIDEELNRRRIEDASRRLRLDLLSGREPSVPPRPERTAPPLAHPPHPVATIPLAAPTLRMPLVDPTPRIPRADPLQRIPPADPTLRIPLADPTPRIPPADPILRIPPADPTPRIPLADPTPRIPLADLVLRIPLADPALRIPPADPTPRIPLADPTPRIPLVHVDEDHNEYPKKNNGAYCREIYTKLRAMFPNIRRGYIKRMIPAEWAPHIAHDIQFAEIVDRLLASEGSWELEFPHEGAADPRGAAGPVRTVDETYEQLLGIFPDADPKYLREAAEKNFDNDEKLDIFVENNLQRHNYPTRDEYLSKMRITEEQRRYTDKFSVPEFLEKFPEPFKHFMDEKRKCQYETVCFEFLKSQFSRIRVATISRVYSESMHVMSVAAGRLREISSDMCSTRKMSEMPTEDINMLQEMAFIRHQDSITKHIDQLKQAEQAEFEKLKSTNGLLECQCCFDDECMPSKCSSCDQGHIFCNSCIVKGTDTKLGESETHVPCFQDCGAEFSLATLQGILKPTKFSILVKKRQAAEVAAAGLEGLVSCPFCHFASIPPEGDKVFKCLNPECMKESCIQCKEPNHVPLRCDEVGKTDKARKYIEEKMTEALARKCYNCKKSYFKEEGCNKITCPCGAIMCYLCDKKIQDYSHFRGQGSDEMGKCPLHSDNAVLNAETVRRVAKEAKNELLRQDPSLNIETDHLLPAVPPPSIGPHQQILQDAMARAVHAVAAAHAAVPRHIAQNRRHVHHRP